MDVLVDSGGFNVEVRIGDTCKFIHRGYKAVANLKDRKYSAASTFAPDYRLQSARAIRELLVARVW